MNRTSILLALVVVALIIYIMYDKSMLNLTDEPENMENPTTTAYQTTYSYDPIAEMHDASPIDDTQPKMFDTLYDDAGGDSDFDNYTKKGYIPGYSDVYLYNKDGSDTFADLYRGATEEGRLRWGEDKPKSFQYDAYTGSGDSTGVEFSDDPILNKLMRNVGGRGDNHAAQLHAQQQRRSEENRINTVLNNRTAWEHIYREELDENENREWWGQDNYYSPIQKLT